MARNFVKIKCAECGNEQKIYSAPAQDVECLVCGAVVAASQGGKAEFNGEVLEELEVE